MIFLAHAGEEHETTSEATQHLLTQPYISVPLFILVAIGVYYLLILLKASHSTILLVELTLFFVAGVGMYTVSPAVSIFALSVGIAFALFATLASLSNHG